ncbi:MAG: putative Ig domain-containing protein [Tepidisphaeraceae bacterium]
MSAGSLATEPATARATAPTTAPAGPILTPPAGPKPRLNGASVFGVRPGHPILFTVPATGERPITFSATNLPDGVRFDSSTGRLSGTVEKAGDYTITLHATNAKGAASRPFKLVVGETLALTPPMGWNHYNIFGTHITQDQVLAQAKAMVNSGLIDHGWSYVNIDDGWQGRRGGPLNAIQPDPVCFSDMKALAEEVHAYGLKLGLYSTPWIESYGHRVGGSAMNPQGTFEPVKEKIAKNKKLIPFAIGTYHFWDKDAQQLAQWGVDYLKYDWNPIEVPETREMYEALRGSGRDVVFSLSNSTPIAGVEALSKYANAWRTGGDIRDTWAALKGRVLTQDKWARFAGPGHWNDPDMMVVGVVGWNSPAKQPSRLTADEQYTHMSAWCLQSVPLLLGCDLTRLDPFTIGLLTNDEVIAVDQDPLGRQATIVTRDGNRGVLAKDMADGSKAAGLFNMDDVGPASMTLRWADLGIKGPHVVCDLWRQQDLGTFDDAFTAEVNQHGVVMIGIRPAP